jgi:hypothetical protein|tara:strand:- start:819 stop:1319 length:501 start_codon:yes stop_codon:yes gene_type:complete
MLLNEVHKMKLFKIIFAVVVFVVFLTQTAFTVRYAHGFEVSGSNRVPVQVPRDVNLRDAQPVRVRIVAVEEAYEERQETYGTDKCYYEKRAVETIDTRGFLTKLINPSTGGTVYENQYNCYTNPKTVTMRVEVGYIVTYQRFGRHYQKFMYNRPHGKYITIMTNEG